MEHFIILYLITGALAGTLAGLLGVGGGIVVVPMLTLLFRNQHFPSVLIMHMAVGTSLAIMIFTTLSSSYAYYQKNLIIWSLFYRFTPGLLIGAMAGSWIAKHISSENLTIAFAIFMLVIATHMIVQKQITKRRPLPDFAHLTMASSLIGIFSGFFGIGGGSMMVPFFTYCDVEMHKATGTSSFCGFPLALMGTISLIATGWDSAIASHAPIGSTGFVYWPATLFVAITSVLCAPLGARLAIRLPSRTLRRVFAVVLILTVVNLLTS